MQSRGCRPDAVHTVPAQGGIILITNRTAERTRQEGLESLGRIPVGLLMCLVCVFMKMLYYLLFPGRLMQAWVLVPSPEPAEKTR